MLERFPSGIVAVVSDSYNIWDACEKLWGGALKEIVEGRKGTLVVRPDSGDPPEVVVKVSFGPQHEIIYLWICAHIFWHFEKS